MKKSFFIFLSFWAALSWLAIFGTRDSGAAAPAEKPAAQTPLLARTAIMEF